MDFLQYLYSVKVATFSQIQRDVFGGRSKGWVSRNISALREHNLISVSVLSYKGSRCVFQISPLGCKLLFDDDDEGGFGKKNSEVRFHDLTLNDIRYVFKK